MKTILAVFVLLTLFGCQRDDMVTVKSVEYEGESKHKATVESPSVVYEIYCEDYSTEDAQHQIAYSRCTLSSGDHLRFRLDREGDLRLIIFTPDQGRWIVKAEHAR